MLPLRKILPGAVALAVLVALYYVLVVRPRQAAAAAAAPLTAPAATSSPIVRAPAAPVRTPPAGSLAPTPTPAAPDAFPLKRGSRGPNVTHWQEYLFRQLGVNPGPLTLRAYADGQFGPATARDTMRVLNGRLEVTRADFDAAMRTMTPTPYGASTGIGAGPRTAPPTPPPAGPPRGGSGGSTPPRPANPV